MLVEKRLSVAMLQAVIMIGAVGCGPSDSDFASFGTYESPDRTYMLALDIAPARTVYGPVILRVNMHEPGSREAGYVTTAKIANDGGAITETNIKVRWVHADTAQLCLSGAEQEDQVLEISAEGPSHSIRTAACSQ